MTKIFPNLMKIINLQMWEEHQTLKTVNTKKTSRLLVIEDCFKLV